MAPTLANASSIRRASHRRGAAPLGGHALEIPHGQAFRQEEKDHRSCLVRGGAALVHSGSQSHLGNHRRRRRPTGPIWFSALREREPAKVWQPDRTEMGSEIPVDGRYA